MTSTDNTGQTHGNILVVDDVPANLILLTGMLKEKGYRVRPVPNGKMALKAVEHEPPDLILLDINMPEMDGFEVCRRLKQDTRFRDIPIIIHQRPDRNAGQGESIS
jgi:CheY-like chemotaxis protein